MQAHYKYQERIKQSILPFLFKRNNHTLHNFLYSNLCLLQTPAIPIQNTYYYSWTILTDAFYLSSFTWNVSSHTVTHIYDALNIDNVFVTWKLCLIRKYIQEQTILCSCPTIYCMYVTLYTRQATDAFGINESESEPKAIFCVYIICCSPILPYQLQRVLPRGFPNSMGLACFLRHPHLLWHAR